MFNIYRQEIEWSGHTLRLETGKIARQADGAVMVTMGQTTVLCTVVASKQASPEEDFLPLTVNYQDKSFAVGRIPGGFFKREGRSSENEILISRLIDRAIRPLFAEGFHNETQVICTVLSHDLENRPDILALIGTSAALTISGIPFLGPIGAVRVGLANDQYILCPLLKRDESFDLDLVIAGTRTGVLMVESEANELSEEVMLGAIMFGYQAFQPVIDMIIKLAEMCAKDPWELPKLPYDRPSVIKRLTDLMHLEVQEIYQQSVKQTRQTMLEAAKQKAIDSLAKEEISPAAVLSCFNALERDVLRKGILNSQQRIDGRDTTTVRPIKAEVGLLGRAHGSALFTRGETQALVVATLGTAHDEQIIESLEGDYREQFIVHYNFPPYSVNEVGRLGTPKRREIGHGKLIWRAIHPLLPTREQCPYTIRIVSEITESNGSSSMATICGASLALMDAGVPLARPVAGIAMGLIEEEQGVSILSDILGDEDHLGDMDLKAAGTEHGITALQMDIKRPSLSQEIMKLALHQARKGWMHILSEMAKELSTPRAQINMNVPRISVMTIPRNKIRDVIGSGGKVIREIVDTTGAKINVADDGTIKISAADNDSIQQASDWIASIVTSPEIGLTYTGKVVKIVEFGAFVNFFGNRDGLVHISELVSQQRVNRVSDVVQVGDTVKVKVIGFDDRGKIKLSMRQVDQKTEMNVTKIETPHA